MIKLPNGQEYCCDDLASWDHIYGSQKVYYEDGKWTLKFFDNAWSDEIQFEYEEIRYCPFCRRKLK